MVSTSVESPEEELRGGRRIQVPRGTARLNGGHRPPAYALQPGLPDDPADLPRRKWIGGPGWFIPRALNLISGAPGVMKTTVALHFAAALAAGVEWVGMVPEAPHRVLVAHYEDDVHEMHRRMLAAVEIIAPTFADSIRSNLAFLDMAAHGPLIQQDGLVMPRQTGAFEAFGDAAATHAANVIIIDPLAEAIAVQENDNAALRFALVPLRRLAQQQDAALILCHHDRKGSEGSALDRMRGASSLGGVIRRHLPLRTMTAEQAKAMEVPEDHADAFLCIEPGKTQYGRRPGSIWFEIEERELENGEHVAGLRPWTPRQHVLTPEVLAKALSALRRGIAGEPCSTSPAAAAFFGAALEQAGIPRPLVAPSLTALRREGSVKVREWRDPVQRKRRTRLCAEGNNFEGWVDSGGLDDAAPELPLEGVRH
jgi:hypothetical protein